MSPGLSGSTLTNRRPGSALPEPMRRDNLSAEALHAIDKVEDALVATFTRDEHKGPPTGNYAILPPGHASGWLAVRGHYEAVDVEVSLFTGDGPLSRADLNFLEDLGFNLEISQFRDFAVHSILLDRRDPEPGWRLAARLSVLVIDNVFKKQARRLGFRCDRRVDSQEPRLSVCLA